MKTRTTRAFALLIMSLILGVVGAFGQSGTWTKKANTVNGNWSIASKGGKKQLSLKGFKTATAPDLKIFLSPHSVAGVTSKNALQGAILVAKLKSSKGDQTYSLPSGIDLSKYQSVIIHCEKYSKLWGAGKL